MARAYEFRGNAYRKGAELNDWTKQRHEPALEPDLPILDPHHHVWDDGRGRYLIHELWRRQHRSQHRRHRFIEAGSMYRAEGRPRCSRSAKSSSSMVSLQ